MRAFLVTSTITVAILISVVDLYAHPKDSTNKKNLIELFYSIHNFLDSTPKWQLRPPRKLGISYSRHISGPHSVRLGYYRFYAEYPTPPYDAPRNLVVQRDYKIFSLGYLFDFYKRQSIKIQGISEINYRYGSEVLHVRYYYGEEILEGVATDDLGLTVGPRLEAYPIWNIVLSLEPKYSYYFYRNRWVDIPSNKQENNTSSQALSVFAGVGVRF